MPQAKIKNGLVAVLGYGSQGRAVALNLRDSGYDVIIGLTGKSRSRNKAKKDGFKAVMTTPQAVRLASIICFALPDHLHSRIFHKDIEKNLKPHSTLVFLHGFSIHFGFVKPPDDCDIIMVAPHAPGVAVRQKYLAERDLSAFYAVGQNHSRRATKTAIALAAALGFKRSKLVKTTFEDEAVGDLFGEQAVLCGGMTELILSGFELLVKKGLPPENAYLEVAYQLDLIIALIKKHGIEGMYDRISVTARQGSMWAGKKIIDRSVKKRMEQLYDEISSGAFARKLNRLKAEDITKLRQKIKKRVPVAFEKAASKYAK